MSNNKKTIKDIKMYQKQIQNLSTSDLKDKVYELRNKSDKSISYAVKNLPIIFAICSISIKRILEVELFDSQLNASIEMFNGRLVEMKTGEGKTIAAILPAALRAIALGQQVHVMTVNDYLSYRDYKITHPVFEALGLKSGHITVHQAFPSKLQSYSADIVYGTFKNFAFDYLHNNLVKNPGHAIDIQYQFAILDEADSILLDEAKTPLIISEPQAVNEKLINTIQQFTISLKRGKYSLGKSQVHQVYSTLKAVDPGDGDFVIDERAKAPLLTDTGIKKAQKEFKTSYNISFSYFEFLILQAIKANFLLDKNKDYIVRANQILLIEQSTGRIAENRKYSDCLHQAIEAKENVPIQASTNTLAQMSVSYLVHLYQDYCGMSGTLQSSANELYEIYQKKVSVIPSHKKSKRIDYPDIIKLNNGDKYSEILKIVTNKKMTKQPVLIGTNSIKQSEILQKILEENDISCVVLNAKNDKKEAQLIAQAGRLGTVTIATDMAGRGTDIQLGGNPTFYAKKKMIEENYDEKLVESLTSSPLFPSKVFLNAKTKYQRYYQKIKEKTEAEKKAVKALGGLFVIGTEKHNSARLDNQLRGRAGRQGDPGASVFVVSMDDDFIIDNWRNFIKEKKNTKLISIPFFKEHLFTLAQRQVEQRDYDFRKQEVQYDEIDNKIQKFIYEMRNSVLHMNNTVHFFKKAIPIAVKSINFNTQAEFTKQIREITGQTIKIASFNKKKQLRKEMTTHISFFFYKQEKRVFHKFAHLKDAPNIQKEFFNELFRVILLTSIDKLWQQEILSMKEWRTIAMTYSYSSNLPIVDYESKLYQSFLKLRYEIFITALKIFFHL